MQRGWIKVCGITRLEDADAIAALKPDAVGINLWPKSPRSVSVEVAQKLCAALRGRVEIVLVTVDFTLAQLQQLQKDLRPDWQQLHGNEPDVVLNTLGPRAFRAIGLGNDADVERAIAAPGVRVLVDARDDVQRGGTGKLAPASLAERVCRARQTILAGGLHADNVAQAVLQFKPFGVDAASLLESAPGLKDLHLVEKYIAHARAAFAESTRRASDV